MERAADGAVARARARRSVAHVLRQACRGDGRGRDDPVHGDARQALSRRAVSDHRRARAAFQRARPERVPAHPVRDEADRMRCDASSPRTRRARASRRRRRVRNRPHVVPAARERADQQSRNVGVECRARRRVDQARRARPRRAQCRASTSRAARARRCDRRAATSRESQRGPDRASEERRAREGARRAAHGAPPADSAPTQAPAQRFTCRAKHGPSALSPIRAPFQHSACRRQASLRSASRAWRFDENGPKRPAMLAGSTLAAGT